MDTLERIVLWLHHTTSSQVVQLDEARELANDAVEEITDLRQRLSAAEARCVQLDNSRAAAEMAGDSIECREGGRWGVSDVCCHSGLPIDQCDYSCRGCARHFVACPDLDGIRTRCEEIRSTWPRARWMRQSDWPEPVETEVAHEVSDGMRRKTEVHRKDSRVT